MLVLLLAALQAVPTTTLARPAAEFPEGYATLGSLRELPDGRVMVIEVCERVLKLLDLARGVAGQVSRTGAGPGEYRTPGRFFPWPGDSTLLSDVANRRYLLIDPDGKPGRMFPMPPSIQQTGAAGAVVSRGFNPAGGDAAGRLYARDAGLGFDAAGQMVRADSFRLERWEPMRGGFDTVAMLPNLVNPGPMTPATSQDPPFAVQVLYAVAPDGRVALLDPRDYHVEYLSPSGGRIAGRPIPFPRLRVSDGHMQEWRESRRSACPSAQSGVFRDPSGRDIPWRAASTPEPTNWPDVLPPFQTGALSFAPDGLLWVRRTTPAGEAPSFDLLDERGTVVHRVVLPKRARLLGFGRTSVYLARVDEDDLQYLQRHPLPPVRQP